MRERGKRGGGILVNVGVGGSLIGERKGGRKGVRCKINTLLNNLSWPAGCGGVALCGAPVARGALDGREGRSEEDGMGWMGCI